VKSERVEARANSYPPKWRDMASDIRMHDWTRGDDRNEDILERGREIMLVVCRRRFSFRRAVFRRFVTQSSYKIMFAFCLFIVTASPPIRYLVDPSMVRSII